MAKEKIVAIGLLSESDLRVLGEGFSRHFPVSDDGIFDDLLAKLDDIEAVPTDSGMIMRPRAGH
jgi:hypothetical protein